MEFVNKTTLNARTCRDFQSLVWASNAGAYRVVLLVVGVFALFWSIFQLAQSGLPMVYEAGGILIMGLLALFLGQWGYLLRLKKYTRMQQSLWGADTFEKEILFFENEFVQRSELGEMTFYYNQVDALLANRNALVVRMGPSAILLDRKGFTHGTEKEFVLFMKEKIKKNKANKKRGRGRK